MKGFDPREGEAPAEDAVDARGPVGMPLLGPLGGMVGDTDGPGI